MKNTLIATCLWALVTGAVAAQTPKTASGGIYTTAQADRGAATFKTTCTACHDNERFTGDQFLLGWTGKPLHELFQHMSTTMPEDNPGSLKPQQYVDVVAYMLKLNGYPAGKTELASATEGLKTIMFDNMKKK